MPEKVAFELEHWIEKYFNFSNVDVTEKFLKELIFQKKLVKKKSNFLSSGN